MLKKAVDIGEEIMRGPCERMSIDVAEALIVLSAIEQTGGFEINKDSGFLAEVLDKRLKFHGIAATAPVIQLLAFVSNSPGECVLFATVLHALAKRNGSTNPITMDDLCFHAFPIGFPTEESLSTIWDNQKHNEPDRRGSDNSVDHAEAWEP